MTETKQTKRTLTVAPVLWLLGFIAVAVIGGALVMDLSGQSQADRFVIANWSFSGLRIYLWLEALTLVAIVVALGMHVISVGFGITRGNRANLIGGTIHPRVPPQAGFIFVVLGAALVALSITTLVLFNSCAYMRLI